MKNTKYLISIIFLVLTAAGVIFWVDYLWAVCIPFSLFLFSLVGVMATSGYRLRKPKKKKRIGIII